MSKDESQMSQTERHESDLRFDVPAAMHIVSEDKDLLKDILRNYLKYCPNYVTDLERTIQGKELSDAARVAHSLKGSSSNIGAKRMTSLAVSIEYQLRNGDMAQASKLLKTIREEMEALTMVLDAYIQNG